MPIVMVSACSAAPSKTGGLAQNDTQLNGSAPDIVASARHDALILATYKSNGLSMSARTSGTLTRNGSCLMVDHGDGKSTDTLVFPEGQAHWIEAENTLVYKSMSTKIGDSIDIAGGSIDLATSTMAISNLPKDCIAKAVWLVG